MTNKNKQRNFLAGALATASAATLMLGMSNVAFGSANDLTVIKANGKFSDSSSWVNQSQQSDVPVQDGDLLKYSSTSPANGVIVADQFNDVMLDLNGVTNTVFQVQRDGSGDFSGVFVGGVINRGNTVARGLTITVQQDLAVALATDAGATTYGASGVQSGDYSGLSTIDLNNVRSGVVITTNNFNFPHINITNGQRGAIAVGNFEPTTGVVLYANQTNAVNNLIIARGSSVTIAEDLMLTGVNPTVVLGNGNIIEELSSKIPKAFKESQSADLKNDNSSTIIIAPNVHVATKIISANQVDSDTELRAEVEGKVIFQGSTTLTADIGTENGRTFENGRVFGSGRVSSVDYTGAAGSVARLSSNIYSEAINFNNTAIALPKGDALLNGITYVNANINLGTNTLSFQGNQKIASISKELYQNTTTQWGPNTSFTTTAILNNDGTVTVGTINIDQIINIANNSNIVVTLDTPNMLLNYSEQIKVLNITPFDSERGVGGQLILNGSTFTGASTNAYRLVTIQPLSDGTGYTATLSNNASTIVPLDFAAAGIADAIDLQNAQLVANPANTRDALMFTTKTGDITDPVKRAEAFQRLTNPITTQVTAVNEQMVQESTNTIIGRGSELTLQQLRNELGKGAPAAAGDDDSVGGAQVGAWAVPVYSQAIQKAKGGNAGYKVKSGGGVLGFDTLANDNLTIGAAITVLNSDIKMKDKKAGDKAKTDTFMFSVYGAQELVRDFFVQGVASFSSSKNKLKERRLVPTSTNAAGYETAASNYNTMSFSGEVLLGYNAKVSEGVFLTPVAGVRYARFNDESYKETSSSYQNKWLAKKANDKVEGTVGLQLESNFKTHGMAIVPEAHAYITQKIGGKSGKIDARLDGLTSSFIARKDTTAKTFYNVGVGASVMHGAMEYGIGYDAMLASKYVGHQGSLRLRVNF